MNHLSFQQIDNQTKITKLHKIIDFEISKELQKPIEVKRPIQVTVLPLSIDF